MHSFGIPRKYQRVERGSIGNEWVKIRGNYPRWKTVRKWLNPREKVEVVERNKSDSILSCASSVAEKKTRYKKQIQVV